MENTSPKYRSNLPQLSSDIFLTDGGIETTLIFHDHLDLPQFASFVLINTEQGCQALYNYFRTYAALAQKYEVGVILESPSWRSSSEWGAKLDYSTRALAEADRKGIQMLCEIRKEYESQKTKIVISGCIGPRGDGYQPTSFMSIKEAEEYHLPQIKNFSDTNVDLITAITMTYAEEAVGIVKAAKSMGMPVVISFTVETDGKLPSGKTLKEAIEVVDRETENGPLYYMINCAHTSHFKDVIMTEDSWVQRIKGIRANASSKSHEELNECEILDEGNPVELGQDYKELVEKVKSIVVVGGCCGTDDRHLEEIIQACISSRKK